MPIRIKCPNCQTVLGVKDTLAGKKANCPKCRHLLTIPAPKAAAAAQAVASAEDAEALALSAFADEAPKPVPVSTKTIEFECPWCMEMVKVSADLAGKQTPCPNSECKRIVKVPLLKEDKPKDWRDMAPRGPSGAMRKDDEPEGTWTTAQKSRVSTEALEEAGALPVKKEPVSIRTWVKRGVLAAVVLFALLGVGIYAVVAWQTNRTWGPYNAAMAAVNDPNSTLKPAAVSDLYRGAGEFYLLRRDAKEARKLFGEARAKYVGVDTKNVADPERDKVLLELLLITVELGGDAESDTTVAWGDVGTELLRTLMQFSTAETKLVALRELSSRLVARGQKGMALSLAEQLSPPEPKETGHPEPPADPPEGDEGPKQPPRKDKAKPPPSPLIAGRVALTYSLGDQAEAAKALTVPNPRDEIKDLVPRLAFAEGKARKGEWDAARQLAKAPGPALHRLEASLAVAAVALAEKKAEEAKQNAQDARLAYGDLKKQKAAAPAWLLVQLVRTCARADMAAEAKDIAAAIADKNARALAQLELFLVALEDAKDQQVPASTLDDHFTVKDTIGFSLAVERLARHNTRLGYRSEALSLVRTVDEMHRPFVQMGVALGQQDARK
jgi:hypothetical protein